jgi:hypothetical protein
MEEIGPMSGGRSSREKGIRAERQIVELFRQAGLEAYRIPLSGSVAGFKSDVELRIGAKRLHLESKVRGGRFSMIYRWLFGADALVIKKDCNQPLIVMRLTDFASLLSHMPSSIETITHKPPQSQAPDSLPIKHPPQPIYRP